MQKFLIFLIIPLVSSNIWDNIFGNFNAPAVVIPSEFTVSLGTTPMDSPYLIKIDYSTKFRSAYFEVSWRSLKLLPYNNIEQGYLNMTSWRLQTRRGGQKFKQKCEILLLPQLSERLADVSGNPSTSKFLDPQTIFQLISFYSGENDEGLLVYDMSSLLSSDQNKIYALFDKNTRLLRELDLKIGKNQLKLYTITPLIQKSFTKQDFQTPEEWKCDTDYQEVDLSKYTMEEILEKIGKKSIQEEIIQNISDIINGTKNPN